MPLELTRPMALLMLCIALPWVGYYFVRSLSDFPKPQRIVSLIVRSVTLLLVALALAGLTFLHQTEQQFVVFAIDQSLSLGENGEAARERFLDEATAEAESNDHQFAILPFGAAVGTIRQTREATATDETRAGTADSLEESSDEVNDGETTTEPVALERANADGAAESSSELAKADDLTKDPLDQDGTNIAAAIEAASGFIPPGYVPKIVVVSDGNQTQGDAISSATRSRVPISTVLLPAREEPEVQVSEVRVPAEVRQGEPFFVEVVVHSNHDDEAMVEVYRGDHKVIGERKTLTTGENRFRFQQSVDRDRLAAYSVRISGLTSDTLLDNNMEMGLVFAAGQPRVLIVDSAPNQVRELAYALEDEGVQADVRPPQGMPSSLADLQNYELVVISNVPATALTMQQMDVVRTYVQDLGGGLIMLGGEQSFGLGGYYKTTLEEILPVRSDFEKEKEKPSLGMVLVIDKSGSMSGDKIEMAKSAARSAVELLGRRDKVAVLAFDGETFVISDMQAASNKGAISDDISRIDAGGGTTMYPAMEMSFEMLQATSAKLKHVILLTDGVSSPGDFEGMAQMMVSSRMTVSTVAVGDGADVDLLDSIARIGKGRHYVTNDPAQVPQIFAKETVTASKSAIDEQPFLPQVVRATHALSDLDMEAAPFLLGYVMTRPKPTSEVILATERGDPLLAWWRYGLGMTVAFTSDAKNRWAAEWTTWPGFGKFWTQVIRHAMRKSDARGVAVETRRSGARTRLSVDAVDEIGQFLNDAQVEMTLIDPRLRRENRVLQAAAPGRYTSEFETADPGAYHVDIVVKQHDQVVYRQTRGLTIGYSDELRIRPPDEALLRTVSEVSGGEHDIHASDAFASDGRSARRPTPLWPYLLAAAACLLVIDVALRRIDFSTLIGRGAGSV